jgi:hypothetical protein
LLRCPTFGVAGCSPLDALLQAAAPLAALPPRVAPLAALSYLFLANALTLSPNKKQAAAKYLRGKNMLVAL